MSDALPVGNRIRFGVSAAVGNPEQARHAMDEIARWGYDIVWAGDHVAFTGPINDPFIQLSYFSALRPELTYGTSVYLLPLRNPTTVAKMVATLDRILGAGHFIFGVGVGGEFPPEFEASGVPVKQRGGRATEAIGIIKRLWTEDRVEHRGKYFSFGAITMEPKPATPGGPPIWVGGRAEAALKRAALYGDGWMPYAITPKRVSEGIEFIAREAERAGREIKTFGTCVHLFCTLGASYEAALEVSATHLSKRYAMDFREPARRYAALGTPADVAARIGEFIKAGVRDIGIDSVCHPRDRSAQLDQFAREVIPLIRK
ncbi:MAG TPA: LLM class flavin-dependent oxidoreductase [Candidatus Binataceae bacterium]|nr:LLM class flavin-dependent oxidoreductase [Candidatus Binataceae bacterium]